jgi:hypothetical protein
MERRNFYKPILISSIDLTIVIRQQNCSSSNENRIVKADVSKIKMKRIRVQLFFLMKPDSVFSRDDFDPTHCWNDEFHSNIHNETSLS